MNQVFVYNIKCNSITDINTVYYIRDSESYNLLKHKSTTKNCDDFHCTFSTVLLILVTSIILYFIILQLITNFIANGNI